MANEDEKRKPTAEELIAQLRDETAGLREEQGREADAKILVAGYLKDIETELKALEDVRECVEHLPAMRERFESFDRVLWATYYMCDMMLKWLSTKDAELAREMQKFRAIIEASGLLERTPDVALQIGGDLVAGDKTGRDKKGET